MSKLYNVQEVAQILKVSPNTIRKWISLKKIPFVKIGSLIRFKEEEIARIEKEGM